MKQRQALLRLLALLLLAHCVLHTIFIGKISDPLDHYSPQKQGWQEKKTERQRDEGRGQNQSENLLPSAFCILPFQLHQPGGAFFELVLVPVGIDRIYGAGLVEFGDLLLAQVPSDGRQVLL